MMKYLMIIFFSSSLFLTAACHHSQSMKNKVDLTQSTSPNVNADTIPKVVKTEAQWKAELSPMEYIRCYEKQQRSDPLLVHTGIIMRLGATTAGLAIPHYSIQIQNSILGAAGPVFLSL